jgi:hypothetical protein
MGMMTECFQEEGKVKVDQERLKMKRRRERTGDGRFLIMG